MASGLAKKLLRSIPTFDLCVGIKGFLPDPYEQRTALDDVVQK